MKSTRAEGRRTRGFFPRLQASIAGARGLGAADEGQLYRNIVDQAFVGIAQADADGVMRFVNQRWCEMLGYRAEELVGMQLTDVIHPDHVQQALEAIRRLAEGGEDFILDKRYLRKDGTILHATSSVNAMRDDAGHFLGVTLFVVDSTRRMQAEALQHELRRALELVACAAPLPTTLAGLIRTAEHHSAHGMAGQILLMTGGTLRQVAAASLSRKLQLAVHEVHVQAPADSEILRRIEVASDPRWAPLRDAALRHGWHACWAQPIVGSHGQLLGAFVLYYRTPCRPEPDDCAMVDLMLRTAALAIERAQSQAELHEREERLRIALDTGRLGEWSLDLRSLALRANAIAKAHYGLPADAPMDFQRLMRERVHPEDQEVLRNVVRKALRGHRWEFDLEHRALWPDGTVHWIHTRGRVSRDATGHAEALTGVCLDTTERRQVEESLRDAAHALRSSEARLRNLTDVTPALLWSALPDGRVTYVSERWYDYTRLDHTGSVDWMQVLHPDDAMPVLAAWKAAVAAGGEFEAELRMRRHDGVYRWFLARAMPLHNEAGEATCWFGSSTDIDDRRRAEEALRVSEQRAWLAMELAQVGTWTWDPCRNRIRGDDRWCAMLGLEPGADLGLEHIGRRIHRDDWPRVKAALLATLAPESNGDFSEEYRWVHRDDGTRWTTVRGQMLYRDAGGGRRPLRMIGSAIDVTRRRNNEEALRDADRRKDEFLAMLAHELRNPLAPLRTSLHMLRMDVGESDRHRLISVMDRQVGQLVRLVDDLLEVSRITRGKIALHPEHVAVADIIDQAVETSRPLLDAAHHVLTLDLPPEPLELDVDPVRIAQVLSNLLNNAAKYTEPGGRIVVSARREDPWLVLRVQDNGAGIAPEQLPHVFDLFLQVERTLHRAQGGLGIGLTLVRQLVELHGGSVHAYSEGVGQGSCFEVRLPMAAQKAAAVPAREQPAACEVEHCRVLVVDDNREHTEALSMFLRLAGHEVHGAYDGAHGLAEAETFAPDAILLDVGLPDLDGFEVCRRLRAQPGGQARVLVAITGWGQADDRRRSREAGFDAHLVKPVDPEALLALVESLCRMRHQDAADEATGKPLPAPHAPGTVHPLEAPGA